MPKVEALDDGQAGLLHLSGLSWPYPLEACWQKVTGGPLPGAVRDYVHSYRPEPGDTPEGADQ